VHTKVWWEILLKVASSNTEVEIDFVKAAFEVVRWMELAQNVVHLRL
jgi:hypothetical protein